MVNLLASLSQIRLTAAEILAMAVTEYVSNSYKISGGELPWGFYYDFIIMDPFFEQMLPLIEERMYQIALQNFEIKFHEMLPKNSADYLRCHNHFYGAHFAALSSASLVQIFQMGEFIDMIQGQPLSTSGELKAFKLLGVSQRSDLIFHGNRKKVVRIYGVASHDKKTLKACAYKRNIYPEIGHLALGEKMGLFALQFVRSLDYYEKVIVAWRGEGEQVLHDLKELWRKLHLKEGFELVHTTEEDLAKTHQDFYKCLKHKSHPLCIAEIRPPLFAEKLDPIEGFFTANNVHRECVHIFCLENHLIEKITSSLKFLEKIPSIFQLDSRCIISPLNEMKARIQQGEEVKVKWMLQDSYGRVWSGPHLTIRRWNEEGIYLLQRNALCSLEQMVAFILEDRKKDLSQKKEFLSTIANLDE